MTKLISEEMIKKEYDLQERMEELKEEEVVLRISKFL